MQSSTTFSDPPFPYLKVMNVFQLQVFPFPLSLLRGSHNGRRSKRIFFPTKLDFTPFPSQARQT